MILYAYIFRRNAVGCLLVEDGLKLRVVLSRPRHVASNIIRHKFRLDAMIAFR